jgi:hypothetical protein
MLVALAAHAQAQAREIREIGPEADLCATINSLEPGGELVLRPGEYPGGCTVRQGGLPGMPTLIRAKDMENRPRILGAERHSNIFTLRADHLTFRGLDLGPSRWNEDGFRIHSRGGITIERCRFTGLGGIAVVATHSSVHGLVVRGNVITGSESTGMYFGCHDGDACAISGLVVEGNQINGVRARDPEVGYGLQVKLNSVGVIRDNVIVDTKGPGIMVYGSRMPDRVSLVERNVVMGSLRSSGIVVGGGPVIVRNNVVIGNREAGIGLEDYGRRGLLRGVIVVHNTAYGNPAGGITVPEHGLREAVVINNAAHAPLGAEPFPPPNGTVRAAGNVNCTMALCFENPQIYDFSPAPGSPLPHGGITAVETWMPTADLFGAPRPSLPTAGAIEGSNGPLPLPIRP